MSDKSFTVRYALLLFVLFGVAGCYGLAVAMGKASGPSFKGLADLSAFLVLLSGVSLMWRAEHTE
jgi:hypothetical protein